MNTTKVTELPAPGYPMLTRLISKPIFCDGFKANVTKLAGQFLNDSSTQSATRQQIVAAIIDIAVKVLGEKIEPMVWIVGNPHPLVPGCKVVRMFIVNNGVEIYSSPSDPANVLLMRNTIPNENVLLIEEAMPLDIFVEELSASEGGDDDEIDPDEPDEPVTPPAPQANPVS